MKKTYALMASLLLLAACNGEEEIDETEDVEETDTVEESNDESDEPAEDDADVEEADDTEADSESDEDNTASGDENQFAGNSYYLSIQHGGQLQPFGELVFDEDTVTLEQEDGTYEGTYTVEGKSLSYEIENDDETLRVTLVQNDYEGEIVVEGHVERYELESDNLTTDEEEAIEELQGAIFMMTKNS